MASIDKLLDVMSSLRDPETGCPWDRQQDFTSLIPFTIEETYEVADAIERQDFDDLKTELGDLLFQVVFYSQLAREQQLFDFSDVAEAISEKLIRRHPHVFADSQVKDAEDQSVQWEKFKQVERHKKASEKGEQAGVLDNVSRTLPAMMRAEKLQRRAARVGFDWPDIQGVFDKVSEELEELKQELIASGSQQRISEEVGDLLFSCINLARHAGVDAELSLRHANQKFETRFRGVERVLANKGKEVADAALDELENAWQQVKQAEE